jgi:hypothetical protein
VGAYEFHRTGFDADQLAMDIEDALGLAIFTVPQEAGLNTYGQERIVVTTKSRDLSPEELEKLRKVIAEHVPRPFIYKGNFARVVTQHAPSVGRVVVRCKETGEEKFASGFLFKCRDRLLTAAHVVEKGKWEIQCIEFGNTKANGTLVYYDLKRDIALLVLAQEIKASPIKIRYSLRMPEDLGMNCVGVGYPNIPGMEPSPSFYELSIVSRKFNYIMGQQLLEMSTHLGSGMSGAPLLNEQLSLAGMVIGYPGEDGPWPKWTPVAVPCNELTTLSEDLFQ